MATLEEIRAKLKADKAKRGGGEFRENAYYNFWDMEDGKLSVIRFLPDGNPDNLYFWVNREMIKLPFSGILGEPDSKKVIVTVPCMEMYGGVCPVITEIRPWYKEKDEALTELANTYWKKRSYIFHGFVVEDGVGEATPPENPIRRFTIGPQLYNIIEASLNDTELKTTPTDYERGVDFRIKKTFKGAKGKGDWADYSTSTWSRNERPLSQEELDAINTFTLPDLATLLPKQPTPEEVGIIQDMFKASVNGEAYDPERWGAYYKPLSLREAANDAQPAASTHIDAQPANTAAISDPLAIEALAAIRNRFAAK
jgi:hypothetical protein